MGERLYGYTRNGTYAHVLSAFSARRAICGVGIVTVPDPQPDPLPTDPQMCQNCAREVSKLAADWSERPRRGECPYCGADVSLDHAGRLRAHGQYRMGPSGPYRSAAPCPGKGLEPADE